MAGEIEADYVTGRTLYAQLRNSVGQVYNGSTFEAYATGNIANYDIAMTEQGTASGFYVGNMPAASAGIYNVIVKERAGGSPAETDLTVAVGEIYWSGTVVDYLAAFSTLTQADVRAAVGLASANLDTQLSTIDTVADAILVDTAEIGAAGAGLSAVPWNASWDPEVQSEVADALAVYDGPTQAEVVAAFTEIKGATWSAGTDTLEAIRDRGDAAWTTAVGFSTLTQADVRLAVGLASANLDTQLSTIDTVVDTILVDTNELQTDWVNGGRLDNILDARASQASVDTVDSTADAILITAAAIELDTQDIQTRLPAALVGGRIDASIGGSSIVGLDRATKSIAYGTVTTGATTTSIPVSAITPALTSINQLKGLILKFDGDTTTAALRGAAAPILSHAVGGPIVIDAADAFPTAPASGDTFSIA